MERLLIFLSVVLLVANLLSDVASADNTNPDASTNLKRNKPMWFGPRLGRKKRNPGEDSYRTPAFEREQLETLMEMIQEAPWAIVAVNEGKRHTVNFTPRLGRESGEEIMPGGNSNGDRWLQEADVVGALMSQRSPPFAPRLGRRMVPFSPRLGRENDRT